MNFSTLSRLRTQLDCLPEVLGAATPEALCRRPASGKWSAQENLAHLVRHHEIMLERIHRILSQDAPRLDRYNAEEDADWPRYVSLATAEVFEQLRSKSPTADRNRREAQPGADGPHWRARAHGAYAAFDVAGIFSSA